MSDAELKDMEILAQKYGPPNGWTASHGTLAAALLKCVRAYRAMKAEQPAEQKGLWE